MRKFLCFLFLASKALAGDLPVTKDLALWLDASEMSSIELDENKRVKSWVDRRRNGLKAIADRRPGYLPKGMNGLGLINFQGKESLKVAGALKGAKEATVFVVFRRAEDQVKGKKWQKLVTNANGNKGVNLDTGEKVQLIKPRVYHGGFHVLTGEDLAIATSHRGGGGELWGDIAEILVYRRTFYVEEPIAKIVKYLEKKWNFQEDRSEDWTRVGPLPVTPERISDKLPLSDQKNVGKWSPYLEMWDEFDTGNLDGQKWWDHNPEWYGRPPARYLAREVKEEGGELLLSMRKDTSLKVERFYGKSEYRDYSSGSVVSKKATVYGYFEIRAKAMASAGSSAWWFTGSSYDKENNNGVNRVEIDVFELGGRSKGREQTYSMNLHVFQTPSSRRHWNRGGEWEAPFKFAEGYHTFGLEWGPEAIRYYIDGGLVRSVKNDAWHAPMYMLFDSETMIDWLGVPEDKDLPSTFHVKYVRAWKNAETNPKWWERYRMRGSKKNQQTRATKYVRKMEEQGR